MNKLGSLACAIAVASLLFALTARAEDNASPLRGTKEEAVTMVKKGIEYFKAKGADKAFAEFSNPKGQFHDRDLYIIAYDSTGVCLAHGAIAKFIGMNRTNEQDSDGTFFIKERLELMKTKQNFWQQYKAADPLTHKLKSKSTYCEVAHDAVLKDILICAGIYDAPL